MRAIRRSVVDTLGIVPSWLALSWLGHLRETHNIRFLPRTRSLCQRIGVYPIIDHYYEPLINRQELQHQHARCIAAVDWRYESQWHTVETFCWRDELAELPAERDNASTNAFGYYLHNGYFGAGDADVYYSLIRKHKPARIIEIGSGHSTRLALTALARNAAEGSPGRMTCIEPYREAEWLRESDVEHVKSPVEQLELDRFEALGDGDMLFIDSSHIIRPQGDVLFELHRILPVLAPGVLIHIHDIFSPSDYPPEWLVDRMHFWNEQYLVESFLMFNQHFEVLCAVQSLLQDDVERLEAALPRFKERLGDIGATSLWLGKVS